MKAMQDAVGKMKELQQLMQEYKKLDELATSSDLTKELFVASVDLEESGQIMDLINKVTIEWKMDNDAPKEFVLKGIETVLRVYPTTGFLQLAELLQEKIEDEELSPLKEYFESAKAAVLEMHESEVFQRYAKAYLAVYQSEGEAEKEFVKVHEEMQKKLMTIAKEMQGTAAEQQ